MSFDPNQPWPQPDQQQVQQQQQLLHQQGVPNQSTPAGNYQQSQQSYNWVDGNTQVQHQQSQQSWSWQSQSVTQTPMMLQTPQPPAIPGQLQLQDIYHQHLHQQLHQSALAHHQQVMNMHQNMAMSMSSPAPVIQPPQQHMQISYQAVTSPVSQQPQILYQSNAPQQQPQVDYQTPTVPTPVPVQLPDNVYQQYQQQPQAIVAPPMQPLQQPQMIGHQPVQEPQALGHISELPPVQTSALQINRPDAHSHQQPQCLQIEPTPSRVADNRPSGENFGNRFKALERRREEDINAMNREGASVNKRIQTLEQSKFRDQKDSEAKDREIRRSKG